MVSKRGLCLILLFLGSLLVAKEHKSSSSSSSSSTCKRESFYHNLQLQLYDVYGVPVPNTQIWVTIRVLKDNDRVTLQFPAINFQTGQYANNPYEPNCNPFTELFAPFAFPALTICPDPGGYLYTSAGFLPEHVRPTDLIDRSFSVPSNTGNNLSYSYDQIPGNLPAPPAGYILQVTNQGAIIIQCQGTFGNVIPAGNQSMLPTDVTYIVEPINKVKHNKKLSRPITTAQFSNLEAQVFGLRDSHLNDAFDGASAWCWLDNSMETDKTNGILNLMVATGKTKDGKVDIKKTTQLTDLQPPLYVQYDTAVTINRKDKNNIIVSYGVADFSNPFVPLYTYRAVSFDGGKTWPYNGPTNLQPTGPGGLGDNPGVASDIYGNIWYVASSALTPGEDFVNQPFFWVSTDKGVTFEQVAVLPLPPGDDHNGNLFYTFGGDGQGNYGLWFTTVQFNTVAYPFTAGSIIGFIPIYGFNDFGSLTSFDLTSLYQNVNVSPTIAAAADGRVWLYGYPNVYVGGTFPAPASGISTVKMVYKSPGPLDQNYAGPWDFASTSFLNRSLALPTDDSQPIFGYYNFDRTALYDDKRQALYATTSAHSLSFSQNMKLYLAISRDNGQSWSRPIEIANSSKGNRGIQTFALDSVKGDLYLGWYDGRNDPTFQSVEYYAAVITSKTLDKLVKEIPLSYPIYQSPQSVTNCPTCQIDQG